MLPYFQNAEGATYCALSSGDSPVMVSPMLIGFALIAASYIFFHKRLAGKHAVTRDTLTTRLAA